MQGIKPHRLHGASNWLETKTPLKNTHIPRHPLAKLAGKFKGEFWEKTLESIQEFRKREKQEINQYLDNEN
ncbi:MAG: hypothetical protein AAF630_04195 [Cyanobacteria bacterium P01_C01_bin.38]